MRKVDILKEIENIKKNSLLKNMPLRRLFFLTRLCGVERR